MNDDTNKNCFDAQQSMITSGNALKFYHLDRSS